MFGGGEREARRRAQLEAGPLAFLLVVLVLGAGERGASEAQDGEDGGGSVRHGTPLFGGVAPAAIRSELLPGGQCGAMSLRLEPSAAVKERRLATLLEERGLRPDDPELAGIVEDAQLLGSLELAGFRFTWEDVRASRATGEGPRGGPRAATRAGRRADERAVQPRGDPRLARGARGAGGPAPRGARARRRAARAGRARREPPRRPSPSGWKWPARATSRPLRRPPSPSRASSRSCRSTTRTAASRASPPRT